MRRRILGHKQLASALLIAAGTIVSSSLYSQSISSGTVVGTVLDPQQMIVMDATAELRNPVTGYKQSATPDQTGAFRFNNIPPNMYELVLTAPGFAPKTEQVEVRGSVPIAMTFTMQMSAVSTSVDVVSTAPLIDTDPSAHTDADLAVFMKQPVFSPGAGLSSIINNSTGGTASDANGFFHPLGDHAQVSFIIDGQPISDQQSKVFSTQIPANAIQSMELITGAPDAQYGDKSSLVVNAVTRSGLGSRPMGSFETYWGSFGTYGENATFAFGSPKFGNFIAADAVRTGHFLDTPEFLPIHDIGNNETIFDRLDWLAGARDTVHLNLFTARNWFQVPNDYDQLSQDQKQRVLTWSLAPGYQHIFGSTTLLTVNPFVRRDQVDYYPSRDALEDTPATISQQRFLTNYGVKADVATAHKNHNIRVGTQIMDTALSERFFLGITNPTFNPVCLDASGAPLPLPGITNPTLCNTVNRTYVANPNLLPGLVPYDLTRGGSYFNFYGSNNITEVAFYATDTIKLGELTIDAGLRDDEYRGLVTRNDLQPRLGLAYHLPKSNTVLRAAYSRTDETPFNENLLLSSATGAGGLAQNVFGAKASVPLEPGERNQFNAGLQQRIGKYLVFDGDYFWKYTHNGYDFDVLFNTPITFPISWHNSKLNGVTGRLSSVSFRGLQAYMTFGHNIARYFPPENGGLIFQGTANVGGVFRIDHDQAYQQTVNVRYQRGKDGIWGTMIWRFDSGLVVTGVPDAAYALALTPNQEVDIGLACSGVFATVAVPIRACGGNVTSTLLTLPAAGTQNPDHNPDRVDPRNLFDVAFGTDNLIRQLEHGKIGLRFTITNLTNKLALYNFLSTFSGTHFVPPRTYQASLAYTF